MSDLAAIPISEYALEFPNDPFVILGWLSWLIVIIVVTLRARNRDLKLDRKTLIWLAVISLSVLLFTPFFGIPISTQYSNSQTPTLMVFGALPWLVAGGIFGALPAVIFAGLSGLLMAYLQTHHSFTPLIFMTTALLFTLCIRQRYRSILFKLLRFPLVAAIISALAALPIIFLAEVIQLPGEINVRILQGMESLPGQALSFGGMVAIGGSLCIFVKWAVGKGWGRQDALKPGPWEKSLRFKVLAVLLPVLLLFSIGLLVNRWRAAENEVRHGAIQELTRTSGLVSEGLAHFVDDGEDLMTGYAADDRLGTGDPTSVAQALADKMNLISYFDHLAVLNLNGEVIAVHPADEAVTTSAGVVEKLSQVSNASQGQVIIAVTSPEDENRASLIHFLREINDPSGAAMGILWGQVKLDEHFILLAAFEALDAFSADAGTAQILGPDGTIVYPSSPAGETGTYTGYRYPTATFIEGQSLNGQSVMQYYRPVGDTGWAVVTSLPKKVLQLRAFKMLSPSMAFGAVLIPLTFLVVFLLLSPIEKSLRKLESTAWAAAGGDYESNSPNLQTSKGVLAGLWVAVQDLMSSLQTYHSNRSDLLSLSTQLSEQLSSHDSLKIVLLSALERGLSSARILITDGGAKTRSAVLLNRLGLGQHTQSLATLDKQILALVGERGELAFRDIQIGKVLKMRKEIPYPSSLIALPLEWQGSRVGVFWGTFHNGRHPETNDFRFFKDLSQKAAKIVMKAQEAGAFIEPHAQLEGVLNALPDPVLIADNYGRIVFLNVGAKGLTKGKQGAYVGKMLSSVFEDESLLSLFQKAEEQRQSMEMRFPDGKTYHVIAQPTFIEEGQQGVVAWFKDITPYETKDALKNEFVNTASHELRSPLTLIHGYAKILRLTGNLNEQQDKYVKNIVDSVEGMRDLVQNLLSLGRLESGKALALSEITTDDIVKNVVDELAAQASQKNIQLDTILPESPIRFEADRTFLKLALRNLVDNAIKFTKMGGDVIMRVSRRENGVVFEVQDSGIGIAPLDQRRIFNKFNRMNHGGDDVQQGSGLGLAIVKSITERHHGKVWVDSQLGKGSTFYLQIPIKHE